MEDNTIEELMQKAFSGETESTPETTAESTVENVQETAQETSSEPSQQNESVEANAETDTSSLNSESSVEQTETTVEEAAPTQTSQLEFANEQIAEMNDWVKRTGRDVSEYLSIKNVDYSSINDVDLLRYYFKQTNPQYSADEIEAYLDAQYGVNGNKNSREYKLGQMRLKDDAKTAREDFESYRDSLLKAPVEQTTPKQSSKEATPLDVFSNSDFRTELQKDAGALEGITFELNDSDSFTYSLNDAQRTELANSSGDIDGFFNRYTTDDGKFDVEKWNMDRFLIDNLDQVIRAVNNQSRSSATESVIKDMKNVSTFGNKVSNTDQVSDNSIEAQILGELFRNPFNKR